MTTPTNFLAQAEKELESQRHLSEATARGLIAELRAAQEGIRKILPTLQNAMTLLVRIKNGGPYTLGLAEPPAPEGGGPFHSAARQADQSEHLHQTFAGIDAVNIRAFLTGGPK